MPDWLSILKAYVDTLETAIGAIEGATTLHNKLTAARAALLDQITALRMAELDPANLPADIAAISTELANATYGLSAIETLVDDLETAVGAIEGATTLHNKLTAARAALLDQITALRMAELDPANLPADVAAISTTLANATYGLAALETLVDDLETAVGTIEGATTLHNKLTAARAALLDQITALRMAELDPANLPADVAAISTTLANATYGLAALETLVDDLETAVGAIEGATTLHNKLTAARAGYLDNINNAQLLNLTAARLGYIDLLATTEAVGPYSYLDAGAEQDVYENLVVTRRHVRVEFSNRNMTQTGTFRIYRKVDGATYDLYASQPVLVAAGSERAFDAEFTTNQHWKLTYQENVDEAAARAIPYNVITQVVE